MQEFSLSSSLLSPSLSVLYHVDCFAALEQPRFLVATAVAFLSQGLSRVYEKK